MIPMGFQIRAGRGLVGLSQAEPAAHMPMLTRKDSAAIQGVIEAVGVEFVQEDGEAGVQMREAKH